MRRSPLLVPLALLLALLVAPPALAGGWATVGLDSTPAGVAAGDSWDVDITVLQHGRTALAGLTPIVRIRSGEEIEEFTARPTAKPGVYRASVVFPTGGRWRYEVLDGFRSEVPHTFPPVDIAGDGAAGATGGGIADGWLWGAGAAALLALAVLGIDRRRRAPAPRTPEPAA